MDELNKDARRWRCLVRNAHVWFAGAPSWDAIVRIPVVNADDATLPGLIDRLLEESHAQG
jgi:hypothetical protein